MDLQPALHDLRSEPDAADGGAVHDVPCSRPTTHRAPPARRRLGARAAGPLDALEADLADLPAHRAIRTALRRARRPVVVTDFGPDAAALLVLARNADPDVPIVWVETGLETAATRRFAHGFARERSLELRIVHPTIGPEAIRARLAASSPADVRARQELIDVVRDAPLARAFATLDADLVITDARRSAVATGAFASRPDGRLEYAPLFDWDDARTAAFLAAHELPNGHSFHDPLTGAASE